MTISQRAASLVNNPSPIVLGHIKASSDPFGPKNPNGFLNFGIAQNHLMEKEIVEIIHKHQSFSKKDIHYNAAFGKESLRKSFCNFSEEYLKTPKLDPDLVAVQTGVSAICETLSFCLFDEGETILMPTPFYAGFLMDFERRFKAHFEYVYLNPRDKFSHHQQELIQRIKETKPKAILLTTPYNPTGEALDKSFLDPIVELCQKENIHIISDEIYALSHIDGKQHLSLLNYDYKNIHFLYGMAKDFALAGLKLGFFYSRNIELVQAVQAVSYFYTTSTQTQNTVEHILKDNHFLNTYIPENQKRIKKAYQKIVKTFPQLETLPIQGGIFFLADFSFLLNENTLEEEQKLYRYLIDELKINLTPGHAMGMKNYGYFRVCFTRSDEEIDEFIKRLRPLLET